jgi:UDPglucose--hexose-1-phosphate uridylyltransferase
LNFAEHAHRRFNPLTGEWVLCSPRRLERPWQGRLEKPPAETVRSYDPGCYLCPGNKRAGGAVNPVYESIFVFDNDFASLHESDPGWQFSEGDLMVAHAERGICRVICFSPRHDLTLPQMDRKDIRLVVDAWAEEVRSLGNRDGIRYVQIFENKGSVMGCSNPQ